MIDKKFIYAGPSWAKKSFDHFPASTNLIKEWKLEDSAIDLSQSATWFSKQYERLINIEKELPVIYITCEPLNHISGICDEKDVMKFRKNIHENHMNILRNIKNPVAIIGAHTDVSYDDVSNSNNRIIDLSWQNFLLREANIPERYNFGADIIHREWHANDCKIKDQSILEQIQSQFEVWDRLDQEGLMYGPHPTRKGNELYAEYIYDKVQEFINDNA